MEKSRVSLVRCDTYDEGTVLDSVKRGFEQIGGLPGLIRPGESIVLKPNVLMGSDPAKCVTTHPSLFRAVGRLLQEVGAVLSCGDSSGFGSCESNMRRAGLKRVADDMGIPLADFDNGRQVVHGGARLNKKFVIANGVLDAQGLVSLPKLKTHGLMRYTGALKNQFGCIPGMLKGQFHIKMPDPYDFATMLADLTAFVKPRLYVMDGVLAMEGNGPQSGNPRKLGVLMFSTDPVALDAIACRIIGLNPEFVPTNLAGEEAGLGTCRYDSIEVVGDDIRQFITPDFDVVRKRPLPFSGGRLRAFIKNRTCPRPVIDHDKCTRCGTCFQVCPVDPQAIHWDPADEVNYPRHDYDRCIRCYCCQELCPEGAIGIKGTLLGDMFFR